MIGLCIAEAYYLEGLYRVEYFAELKFLEQYRRTLDQRVTTWIMGDPVPKRRQLKEWY